MGQAKLRGSLEERKKQAADRVRLSLENICIICRENKDSLEMSDEHVIPDSLNGYYHIYNVCKKCNSFMGANIDGPLVNHLFSKFYRYENKIAGKSGKIPNPFEGLFSHPSNPNIKYKSILSKNNHLEFKQTAYRDISIDNEGNIQAIKIITDTEKEAEQILKKITKRHQLDDVEFQKSTFHEIVDSGEPFCGKFSVDTESFKLGLLKIAYIFAVDSFPSYFYDDTAIEISKILNTADLKGLDSITMGCGLDKNIFDMLENYFEFKDRHFLMLLPHERGLLCFIKLDKNFNIPIVLSKSSDVRNYQAIVGVNCLKERVFKSFTLFDALDEGKGETRTRFLYYFSSDSERKMMASEVSGRGYSYIGELEGSPILFSKNGKIYNQSFIGFLERCQENIKITDNKRIVFFKFDDKKEVYVKSKLTKMLYRVVGFETENEFKKI